LLVDLSGLEFATRFCPRWVSETHAVECMIADFSLQKGVLNTRTFLLVTKEATCTSPAGWICATRQ